MMLHEGAAAVLALARWIWVVPALPLLAAILVGLALMGRRGQGDAGEGATAKMVVGAAFLDFLLLALFSAAAWIKGAPGQIPVATWFTFGPLAAQWSFLADGRGLGIATLVAFIGWVTALFSRNYLHREPGFHRFFLVLCVFLAAMQIIILAGNALLAFVGWELAGVSSLLLIGFAWHRPQATRNAQFAFVANRIGDAGFLMGLGLAAWWFGSFEWAALADGGQLPTVTARLLVIGFVVAALAKSAQVPFTPWVGRALEGPTPSSAIFYGSVMIHVGVFLMLRLEPVLRQAPDVQAGLAVAGGATTLYAWLVGMTQTDVKSALVFATVGQVGLMFVAMGFGQYDLAAVYLGLHALWRAWQFLLAPSWLQLTQGTAKPAPAWLRRSQWLYTASLQRFWLGRLAEVLLERPTTAMAADARQFEEKLVDRAIGEVGRGRPVHPERPLVTADGLAGQLLASVAERLQKLEAHLALRGRGGISEWLLHRAGFYLRILEEALEQPRYLMFAVMATFVVIL